MTFLRFRTWMELDGPALAPAISDAVRLAELEGLAAHARAAHWRRDTEISLL